MGPNALPLVCQGLRYLLPLLFLSFRFLFLVAVAHGLTMALLRTIGKLRLQAVDLSVVTV